LRNKKQTWTRLASESYFFFKNDYDTDDDSANAYVSKFIVHPDWDPNEKHYEADIAVAVLREPVKLTNRIRHVCLNTPANPIQSFAEKNASVYGWGLTEELELATQLRDVKVPLVDQAQCNSSSPTLHKIMSDTSFCAGAKDGKTGACNGKLSSVNYFLKILKIKYIFQATLAAVWSWKLTVCGK
jgi:hypothetical protein